MDKKVFVSWKDLKWLDKLEMAGMAGNAWNDWKCVEMAG